MPGDHDEEWALAIERVVAGLRRRRTAVHEAAHAVAAVQLRCGLRRVTIIADESSRGHAMTGIPFRKTPERLTARQRRRVERGIMCMLAGFVAEEVILGVSGSPETADKDFEGAMIFARGLLGLSRDEAHELLRELVDKTMDLVEANRSAIVSVAQALLDREVLAAAEVRALATAT